MAEKQSIITYHLLPGLYKIQAIEDRHGLNVIYDAAHSFDVEKNGRRILTAGDISTLSFHASKVYNTLTGGAIVCGTKKMKQKIDYLLFGRKNQIFSIQLKGASPNLFFNEVEIGDDFKKLPHPLQLNYCKTPFYSKVMPLLEKIFSFEDKNFARFLLNSSTNIILSSSVQKDCSLKGKDKVLDICHSLGTDTYLNAIGSQDLYDKEEFAANSIDLFFVETNDFSYSQFSGAFGKC